MNNNEPIFVYVGAGHPDIFMVALHEIIQESQLPIMIVQAEEPQPVPQPLDFHIPDTKIEDFIEVTNIIEKSKPIYHRPNKDYKQTYRKFRDTRNIIKMKTHRTQRKK